MSDRFKRTITVTLLFFGIYLVLLFIPMPGFHDWTPSGAMGYYQENSAFMKNIAFSIGAVGLGPFFAATILVELFAALFPIMQPWRHHLEGRAKLFKISLWLSIPITLWSAYLYTGNLLIIGGESNPILNDVANTRIYQLIAIFIYLTTTLLAVHLALKISQLGLVSGFALIFVFDYMVSLLNGMLFGFKFFLDDSSQLQYFLLYLFNIGFFLLLTLFLAKKRIKTNLTTKNGGAVIFRFLVGGLIPVIWAYRFIEVFGVEGIGWDQYENRTTFIFLSICLIIPLNMVLGWVFNRSGKLGRDLLGRAHSEATETLSRTHWKIILISTTVLFLFFGGSYILGTFFFATYFANDIAITVALITLFCLDLSEVVRLHLGPGQPIAIGQFQQIHLIDTARDLLTQKQIAHAANNYFLRGAFFFLAPFLPVTLWVDEARAQEARDILAEIPKIEACLIKAGSNPKEGGEPPKEFMDLHET